MRKMIGVATLAIAMTAQAQPIFNRKQITICQRPVPSATDPGDVTKASVVTMHYTDAPLRQVLTDFCRQIDAGVVIEATNDGYLPQLPSLDWTDSTNISVDMTRADYWDAVRELVRAVPIALDPIGRDGTLRLVEHAASAGNDYAAQHGVLAMAGAPGERRVGALLLAPTVLRRNYENRDETRLILAVVPEPRVRGTSGLGVLHLVAMTGSDGSSLLRQPHEFVTDRNGSWAGEYSQWGFDLGDPPANGVTVKTLRGDLRLGIARDSTSQTLSLTGMFRPMAPVIGEVQADERCQIFRPPSYGEARGTQTSRDRIFPDECKVVDAHHGIPKIEGGQLLESEKGHSVYTEERTLVLHNITKLPETFVITTTFRPDVVLFTSDPKPKLMRDYGEYRMTVQPGATIRLHIAYRVDQSRHTPPPTLEEVPLAPRKLWQIATVGSTSLTVKAVVPDASEYVVRGTFSSPVDGIVAYACPTECGTPGINDAQGRAILHFGALGALHREGKRNVVDWSARTVGRGLVPATLSWTPGTTSWILLPLS